MKFFLLWMVFAASIDFAQEAETSVTAKPGQTVPLPCRAGHEGDIMAVEWTRPDLEPEYVFLYRDGILETDHQLPSYQNRVDLQDRQMKDGNVSLVLKNVTTDDAGTYECRVRQRGGNHRKRDVDPISTVHLEVPPPPPDGKENGRYQQQGDQDEGNKDGGDKDRGGHPGLVAGLTAVGIIVITVMVVGIRIYKKKSASHPQSDYV